MQSFAMPCRPKCLRPLGRKSNKCVVLVMDDILIRELWRPYPLSLSLRVAQRAME